MSNKYATPWKGSKIKPEDVPQSDKPRSTPASATEPTIPPGLTGLRAWNESVGGFSAERLRNCIIYLLDVKKDPWYTQNLSRRFVRQNAQRINDEVPEDYVYDPDPLWEEYEIYDDGMDKPPSKRSRLRREPKNPKERQSLRDKCTTRDGNLTQLAAEKLVKKDCPVCNGRGTVDVSDYPGVPWMERLTHSEECRCLYE